MKSLIFNFQAGAKDNALRDAARLFARAGAQVVSSEVDPTTSRRAGVTFRNVSFTFADNQRVQLSVKVTGDVFEVRLNDKLLPLRNQDDHAKAISEIAERMDAARGAYQRSLARLRVPLPPSIRTSRTAMVKALTERRDSLKVAVEEARSTLEKLVPGTATA